MSMKSIAELGKPAMARSLTVLTADSIASTETRESIIRRVGMDDSWQIKLRRRLKKPLAFRLRSPLTILAILLAFVPLFLSHPNFAIGSAKRLMLDVPAWLFFFAGGVMRFWATMHIAGQKDHFVVQTGPYTKCRHPLYFGALLLGVSVALFTGSVFVLAAVLLITLFYLQYVIPAEEQRMRTLHPKAYEDYAREVPCLFPVFSGGSSSRKEVISVHAYGLRLECRRAAVWIWIPLLAELSNHLRSIAAWPSFLPFS